MLALGADEPQQPEQQAGRYGLLARELARQAVLDRGPGRPGPEHRDETLQEPVPDGAAELDSHTVMYERQGLHLWVSRRADQRASYLIDQRVPIGNDAFGYLKALDYVPTIRELERLSRGGFVERSSPSASKAGDR